MNREDLSKTLKTALRQAIDFIAQPYIDAGAMRSEKPHIKDQLMDLRLWSAAANHTLFVSLPITLAAMGAAHFAQAAEPTVVRASGAVANEMACDFALSGVLPIRHLDGTRASAAQLVKGSCGQTVTVRTASKLLHTAKF